MAEAFQAALQYWTTIRRRNAMHGYSATHPNAVDLGSVPSWQLPYVQKLMFWN